MAGNAGNRWNQSRNNISGDGSISGSLTVTNNLSVSGSFIVNGLTASQGVQTSYISLYAPPSASVPVPQSGTVNYWWDSLGRIKINLSSSAILLNFDSMSWNLSELWPTSSPGWGGTGDFDGTTSVGSVSTSGNDINGSYNAQPAATTGNNAGIRNTNARNYTNWGSYFYWVDKFSISRTTNVRFWSGVVETANDGMGNDVLSSAGIGVQFSTVRGDTKFMFLKNNGATQNLVTSSVVPVSGTVYVHLLTWDMRQFVSYLCNEKFVVLDSTIWSSSLPTGNSAFFQTGIQNRTSSSMTVTQYRKKLWTGGNL